MKNDYYYRQIVEDSNSIILRLDTQGKILFANKYAYKFFKYREGELVGRNVVGTILEKKDSSGFNLEKMMRDIKNDPQQFQNNENENITKDKRRVWISWTNSPLYDDKNKLAEIISIGNDVTARKKINDFSLQESENKFLQIADHLEQCIWIKDKIKSNVGEFIYTNQAYEKIFGRPADFFNKNLKAFLQLVHKDDRYRVREFFKKQFNRKCDIEYRIIRSDGSLAWIWSRSFPINNQNRNKKMNRIVGISEDITFRKLAELEYLRALGMFKKEK